MKTLYIFAFVALVSGQVSGMTEKQMKSTAGMVRNVCQSKIKPSNDQIDNMHKGDFEDDPKLKCYMKCVFDTLKMMKNGKFEYSSTIRQVRTLPARYTEPTLATTEICKDSVTSSDQCEAAYEVAKCYYFTNPEYYFFP